MLAIVIPFYKLTFFEKTLNSLANQEDKRFTVYIGDDASPENPTAVLEKYKNDFKFEYKRFKDNLGSVSLVKQWERCIAMTQEEEWIMILGDDDLLDQTVVSEFYKEIEEIKTTSNVVRFASRKIDENGTTTSPIYTHPKTELATDFLFRATRSSLSEFIFHKNKISTIGFKNFPLAWYSDVLAVLEFSDFKTIYSINQAVVSVRISSLSISGGTDNLRPKYKAAFQFYYYLLTQKKANFTKRQIKELLHKSSKTYIYNKKEVALFFKISKIYLRNLFLADYLGFIKAILINYSK